MTPVSLTREFCEQIVGLDDHALDGVIERASRRLLLNVAATAVGASRDPEVSAMIAVGQQLGGAPVGPVPGRTERLDAHWAALTTGFAAHLDDFDDTHLDTVIHPGAAALGAALPLAADDDVSGALLLRAFTLGCEVQLRCGVAMSPWHYDQGWHITGTCGALGAAVAAGTVLQLDAVQLSRALGLAASQTLGHREGFGTSIKPFHPGKAAANGILAALLAREGFTASDRVLDAPRGFWPVLSPRHEATRLLDGFGERWELSAVTIKPYPCGIVIHPAIEAATALAPQVPDPAAIASVVVRCHPLVVELTGAPAPRTTLEARFSARHGVAVGLIDGAVGLDQYAQARVLAPDVTALRQRIDLQPDTTTPPDAVTVEVELRDGRRLAEHVAHVRGSAARQLSDAELEEKVSGLVEPVLPGATQAMVAAVAHLHSSGLAALLDAVTPPAAPVGESR